MSDHPLVKLVAGVIVVWALVWALGLTGEGGGYNFWDTGKQIQEALTPGWGPMPGSSNGATGSVMP